MKHLNKVLALILAVCVAVASIGYKDIANAAYTSGENYDAL